MRLRLDLAYDGGGFHGWASQPGLRTVQATLEGALATVLRIDAPAVTCAGRTDTGVHARGQVVHVDLEETVLAGVPGRSSLPPTLALVSRLNGVLPPDVRVRGASTPPDGFDARFSALWRRYVYRIADDESPADPLTRGHVLSWPRHLNVPALEEASTALLGEHDFAAFCKRREGATTVRTLLALDWSRTSGGTVEATVVADAFCHNMVRSLVGCLVAVGEGKRTVGWPAEILTAGVRDSGVRVMPAHGLTLEEVGYPPDHGLETRARAARNTRGPVDV